MTIYFFEGFNAPGAVRQQTAENCPFEYMVDGLSILDSFQAGGPAGILYPWRTSLVSSYSSYSATYKPRTTFTYGNKLAVGFAVRFVFGNSAAVGAALAPADSNSKSSSEAATNSSNPGGLVNQLPVLKIESNSSGTIRRLVLAGVYGTTTYLWQHAVAGLTVTDRNFFEAVYDFENNRIEVWVNDIQLANIAYTFSTAQKTGNKSVFIQLNHNGQHSGTLRTYTAISLVYAASERLGPCQSILRAPNQDVEVSPEFGEGPFYPRVAGDPYSATSISTTMSLSKALFGSNAAFDQNVLAIKVCQKYSSAEQSALEKLGAAKVTLRYNGVTVQDSPRSIPSTAANGVLSLRLYETSPFSDMPWTSEEVQNLAFGTEMVVDPKPV